MPSGGLPSGLSSSSAGMNRIKFAGLSSQHASRAPRSTLILARPASALNEYFGCALALEVHRSYNRLV